MINWAFAVCYLLKYHYTTSPVRIIAWVVIDVTVFCQLLNTLMVSGDGFDARKLHELSTANLKTCANLMWTI